MFRINLPIGVYLCATTLLAAATCILGQHQQFHAKPWPTYSLQNMPQTRFRCHDKILGGYYADPETQCQMFHVCVKVAGVGVQDFRFLCPNSTAFDQEAQICADWGDVDCEQSVLYYGSDNFDLYRLGSGFESKRAPAAEEEEATFHLQRAESGDIRRSKETRVDQKSRPDQPPNYTKHFEVTTRNSFNNYANLNANNRNQQQQQQQPEQQSQPKKIDVTKKPIVNYYTPTIATTTTTTTERYNDESKQDFDDIFKGSHSSHFFANRNGGREDDFLDHPVKTKPNDFTDYNKKTETSTSGKTRPTRPKRPLQTTAAATTTTTTTTTTTRAPKINKKVTLQTSFNTDFYDYTQLYKSTKPSTTAPPTTPRSSYSNANRFSFNSNSDYQTQEKIQPTTYNPGNNIYRVKTTTPKYSELKRDGNPKSNTPSEAKPLEQAKSYNKPTISSRKAQKLERTQQKLLGPQNSTFVNHNEFSEFAKVPKVQQTQPQPFQPAKVFRAPTATPQSTKLNQFDETAQNIEPQYYRTRAQQVQQSRVINQDPAPFSAQQKQQQQQQRGSASTTSKSKTTKSPDSSPRGFTSRGSINYKATTQRNGELYTPTTSNVKKFSTLVPKDQFTPTTFKPTTYKKPYESNYYQTQQTIRPTNKPQKSLATFTTTPTPTTANPYYTPDEDDGQYHPELYEVNDYAVQKSRSNSQRASTTTTTTAKPTSITAGTTRKSYSHKHNQYQQNPQTHLKTQQQTSFQKQQEQSEPVDLSDEEELFKTAHSLNFGAASINKLRADIYKAEKTSQQYNSQYSPNIPLDTSPKTVVSTTAPSTTNIYTYPHTYSTAAITTNKPYTTTAFLTTTTTSTTTTTTTRRPTTTATANTSTTQRPFEGPKSSKSHGKSSKGKGKKASSKSASKRPPHADEDTSYDYAYYDSDTLSETPQAYPEYEIAEFTKTRKN